MGHFHYVFVILVYRNYTDLKECLDSIKTKVTNSKSIIVDAFYSEECSSEIKKIADKYGCDYLLVENKGYSYGNNNGIKYAKKNYSFDYIVVSNPDIIINNLELDDRYAEMLCVLGPKITNLSKKKQNPMFYTPRLWCQKLIYKGLKHDKKIIFYLGLALNKADRILKSSFFVLAKKIKVYQLHGSFLIFSKALVYHFDKIFDENMFLFAEESYLAYLLKENNIPSYYLKSLSVTHKEDGSMKFRSDINEQLKIANIYVMEEYYKFGSK